jgi:pimeloyl-ACP methyl ester carboxylesterase
MKRLFFLSGLGADKRVFDFLDLPGHQLHYIDWVEPLPGDSMADYARRLLPQIQCESPVLVGVSFGGMIALEIAHLIKVEMIILISSATSPRAIPRYLKVIGILNLQKLITPRPVKSPGQMLFWLFGVTQREHKTLLAAIMLDTKESFVSWAIQSIMVWKGNSPPCKVVQIHGTRDRIFNFGAADYAVAGGHLIIVTNAKEVSEILQNLLMTKEEER